MRAVVYARVSSTAQRDRDTIASQLRDLPAYATQQGWSLVGTHVDDGKSASTGKLEARDGFARLVREAHEHRFDVVVVRDIDRLTRTEDMRERAEILGTFQSLGIEIATPASGRQDLRTMLGELYVTMHALFAAEENRKRRERIVAGQKHAVLTGGKGRGRTPFGLICTKVDGRFEWSLDPVRAPIVREIFERVADGESCLAIATDFELRGVVRPGAKPWTRHRVWELVSSSHPTGSWMCREGKVAVPVPPIVSLELAEQARASRALRRKAGLDRTWHVYLLAKLARCGTCGQAIRVRTGFRSWKGHAPSQYRCVGRWSPLPPGVVRCDAASVRCDEADARAWIGICRELEDPDLVPALVALRSGRATDVHDWERDLAGYKKHLARLDEIETKLLERFRRGAIGDVAMDKELVALNRERKMLREQAAAAERARGSTVRATRRLSDAEAIVMRLRAKLTTATPTQRRDIVATLVDPGGITFHGEHVRLELWIERPDAEDGETTAAMAAAPYWSGRHETELRIRLVA